MMYRQITLASGNRRTTVWLPEREVRLGVRIRFDPDDGREWTVTEVGTVRVSEMTITQRRDDYRHQRQASDV